MTWVWVNDQQKFSKVNYSFNICKIFKTKICIRYVWLKRRREAQKTVAHVSQNQNCVAFKYLRPWQKLRTWWHKGAPDLTGKNLEKVMSGISRIYQTIWPDILIAHVTFWSGFRQDSKGYYHFMPCMIKGKRMWPKHTLVPGKQS